MTTEFIEGFGYGLIVCGILLGALITWILYRPRKEPRIQKNLNHQPKVGSKINKHLKEYMSEPTDRSKDAPRTSSSPPPESD